jgi:hypothetical protein
VETGLQLLRRNPCLFSLMLDIVGTLGPLVHEAFRHAPSMVQTQKSENSLPTLFSLEGDRRVSFVLINEPWPSALTTLTNQNVGGLECLS